MDTKKMTVSNILNEKRDWHCVDNSKPNPGQPVVIRFTNPSIIYGETETEIYPAEDIKIGRFVRDIDDPEKGRWVIEPPFPKYDYSPLSKKESLLEGSIVTHWAEPSADELENWATRFQPFGKYKNLHLEVDPEHEEDVYRALMYGAAFLSRGGGKEFIECPPGTGIRKMYEILCDLQYCIDSGDVISNCNEADDTTPDNNHDDLKPEEDTAEEHQYEPEDASPKDDGGVEEAPSYETTTEENHQTTEQKESSADEELSSNEEETTESE